MKTVRFASLFTMLALVLLTSLAQAQDLGPNIRKISDGIYVYVGTNFNSNCGIVITQDGVVLIDSGHNPTDSRAILAAVKKLTPSPGALSDRYRAPRRSHNGSLCFLAAGIDRGA